MLVWFFRNNDGKPKLRFDTLKKMAYILEDRLDMIRLFFLKLYIFVVDYTRGH